jgi:ribosomal protein L4
MNIRKYTAWCKRRNEMKHGKKPWAQKGSGRARQGSWFLPMFGKSFTNQKPHGLNNKRNLKIRPLSHHQSISTVLQSKWKKMKIIQGLEEWPEARRGELETLIQNTTGVEAGKKSMLIITRKHFGKLLQDGVHSPESFDSTLYMSGRDIKGLTLRRPRDIDITSDALHQCLKARHVIISREAFFDLRAKYGAGIGWAWKNARMILVERIKTFAKEFSMNRNKEIEACRELPFEIEDRKIWATKKREELGVSD